MRTPLELIVRPFVVTNVTSPKQQSISTTSDSPSAADNTSVDIGSDEVTTWSGSFDQTVSFYYIKKPKEKKKDTSTYNPWAPADAAGTGDITGVNTPL